MGEGVSLPLPRKGFPGANLLCSVSSLSSVSFTREHVSVSLCEITFSGGVVSTPFSGEHFYYGGSILPVFGSANGAGILVPGSGAKVLGEEYCSSTKGKVGLELTNGRRYRNGFPVATILVVSVPFSREHGLVGGFNMLDISLIFLVVANCFGDRPIQIPDSLSPLNGKTDEGCLFKKEVEHASFAAADSGAPDVNGKMITVGIVNSRVLVHDLRGSRASDLRLDLLNCNKVLPSSEVAGDTRRMAISWILDPVFKSLLSPARVLRGLFSAGYLFSRGYCFGSIDPYGYGIRVWTSSDSGVWLGRMVVWHRFFCVSCLVNSNLVESAYCAMVICGIMCGWRSHGIVAESLFGIYQGVGVIQFGRLCGGMPTSVVGFVLISGSDERCSGLVKILGVRQPPVHYQNTGTADAKLAAAAIAGSVIAGEETAAAKSSVCRSDDGALFPVGQVSHGDGVAGNIDVSDGFKGGNQYLGPTTI